MIVRAWILSSLGCLVAAGCLAQCAQLKPGNVRYGASVHFTAGSGASNSLIGAAIGKWSDCADMGTGFPLLQIGGSGGAQITVNQQSLNNSGTGECGSFSGSSMNVYSFTKLPNGTTRSCGDLATVLAHEIGHFLGLTDSSCSGFIMQTDFATQDQRSVQSAECAKADDRWVTPEEPEWPDYEEPDPPCLLEPPATETAILEIEGDVLEWSSGGDHDLSRIETLGTMRYLLEDWTIVEARATKRTGRGAVEISTLSSSTLRFGTKVAEGMAEEARWKSGAAAGTALIVEMPVHGHGSRYIPLPEVALVPVAIPYLGEKVAAVLRIDVGEEREIRSTSILHGADSLPGGFDLEEEIEKHLDLSFASSRQHRVIVFLVVDIAEGRIDLRQSLVVRPLCCCWPICV